MLASHTDSARVLRRLLGMSPFEVAYRVSERIRIAGERRARRRFGIREVVLPQTNGSFTTALAQHLSQRFLVPPGFPHRRQMSTFFAARAPERLGRIREEADALLRHRFEILGFPPVDLGPQVDWHKDPLSGETWPRRFWADYDLVRGTGPDPKRVHELNRHGHLPRLAAAYYLTGTEAYAKEAVAQMVSWCRANPPGWGINWCSSLEIAFRVMAWIVTLGLILPSGRIGEAAACTIGWALVAQLEHISRYPSLYSSPNTHLIGEAAALFIGGCFWPDPRKARVFREQGARCLERESRRQVGRDGAHKELSTYYHAYALDFFLLASAWGERSGFPLSPVVKERMGRMADFLAAMAGADGRLPLLGDDDGGSAFPLVENHYGNVRDLLSAAAVHLDRPDLWDPAAAFRAVWLFGPERLPKAPVARRPARVLSSGGYVAHALASGEHHARLLFDAGGMGMGRGGHSHADALAVVLEVDGHPVLVDPGSYVYNREPEWRDYFRGTRAHNTVSVDGLDQSVPGSTFAWSHRSRVRSMPVLTRSWCFYAEAEHDGYRRLAAPVIHRRRILGIDHEYWLVVDELLGRGRHTCVLHYHVDPDVEISVQSASGIIQAELGGSKSLATLTVATSIPGRGRVVAGALAPIQGWIAPRYGRRRAAPVLEVEVNGELPLSAMAWIHPWHTPAVPEIRSTGTAIMARLPAGPRPAPDWAPVDVMIVNPSGERIALPEAESEGGLLWLRREGSTVTHWLTAGGPRSVIGTIRPAGLGPVVTGRGFCVES